jgi:tRNA threonylcarbamoyl adenosine modification protein (Sua5/YciO/YrdC/YwlC family)
MPLIQIHPINPQKRLIDRIARILIEGGVIAYPSDTSYALAANIFDKNAVERMYKIKKSAKTKLFSCVCYDFSKLSEYAFISTSHYRIMKHLLPGPYTFILKGKTQLPKITLSKRKTIGVRMPDVPIVRMLCEATGFPLLSCSMRLSDEEIVNDPHEINRRFGHEIDLVIDGGPVAYAPSSIISLEEEVPSILREGSGDLAYFRGA